ncbi:MAG: hypothetical protein NT154_19005 [Verrucomicrobia bacterium]|nr:hypothetical protein [Verrucomicrobiota bacterium]
MNSIHGLVIPSNGGSRPPDFEAVKQAMRSLAEQIQSRSLGVFRKHLELTPNKLS